MSYNRGRHNNQEHFPTLEGITNRGDKPNSQRPRDAGVSSFFSFHVENVICQWRACPLSLDATRGESTLRTNVTPPSRRRVFAFFRLYIRPGSVGYFETCFSSRKRKKDGNRESNILAAGPTIPCAQKKQNERSGDGKAEAGDAIT